VAWRMHEKRRSFTKNVSTTKITQLGLCEKANRHSSEVPVEFGFVCGRLHIRYIGTFSRNELLSEHPGVSCSHQITVLEREISNQLFGLPV
jgi:hypothetical protein